MLIPSDRPESCALKIHFAGLTHLYNFVKDEETRRLKDCPTLAHEWWSDFESSDCGGLIMNYFIWYSTTFVSFIDLFSRTYPNPDEQYKQFRCKFCCTVKWRNKVAAHFSLVKPQKDTQQTQTASVNQFVSWDSGRFSVGREVFATDSGDSSPNDWGWELTEVHERLLSIMECQVRANG